MIRTPVLLVIFNRPDTTQCVFDAIQSAQPPRLYIAADGPRESHPEEIELCSRTRDVVKSVDWPCEVFTRFQNKNLGCGKGVSSAISWFFEHEEEGIILEDDCLPHPDFFGFCEELLAKYRKESRIAMISGNNFQDGNQRGSGSYYFSNYCNIWGWASWRRAWKDYQLDISPQDKAIIQEKIASLFSHRLEQTRWNSILTRTMNFEIDTWDYQFAFHNWKHARISICPNMNLVSNIGFDSRATHTTSHSALMQNQATHPMGSMVHPKELVVSKEADLYYFSRNILPHIPKPLSVLQRLRNISYKIARLIFPKVQ